MYVICKEGRRFIDSQAARECTYMHSGGCGQCGWRESFLSMQDNQPLPQKTETKNIPQEKDTQPPIKINHQEECPDPKRKNQVFPCPRCPYSRTISERKQFLNLSVWWVCEYPKIINLRALQPEDLMDL
jgi:hypothetical protein